MASQAPHHAKGDIEGDVLLLGARLLVQRREVPEDGLDIGPLLEGASHGLHAMASRVRIAGGRPAIRQDADGAATLAKEVYRLLGCQQWRDGAHRRELLPADDAVLIRLRKEPLRAQEADVAAREHLGQRIVDAGERLVQLLW